MRCRPADCSFLPADESTMSQHHVHLSKLHIGETRFSRPHVAPCRPGSVKRRLAPRLQARFTARGTSVSADKITLKKVLGEGSYGTVFEVRLQGSQPAAAKSSSRWLEDSRSPCMAGLQGLLDTPGGEERVVLKRVKARVQVGAPNALLQC